jgi:hypothetical protein
MMKKTRNGDSLTKSRLTLQNRLKNVSFYHVKIIKGNPYLYRETRWRGQGGQVCSKTEYVCSLAELSRGGGKLASTGAKHDGEAISNVITAIHEKTAPHRLKSEIAKDVIDIRRRIAELPKQSKSGQVIMKVNTTKNTKPKTKVATPRKPRIQKPLFTPFETKFDLKEHQISEAALRSDHARTATILHKIGLDPLQLPTITLKRAGAVTGFRKNIFGSGYTVFLSKGKTTRSRFSFEYRKALARASLDLMEEQNPEKFRSLKSQFIRSFSTTQKHIKTYLTNTDRRGKNKKQQLSKDLGRFKSGQISKALSGKKSPKEVGLVDYSPRANWRDEATAVFAEILWKGVKKINSERNGYIKKSERELLRAECELDDTKGFLSLLSGKAQRANKKYSKQYAKNELQKEAVKKINIFNGILNK